MSHLGTLDAEFSLLGGFGFIWLGRVLDVLRFDLDKYLLPRLPFLLSEHHSLEFVALKLILVLALALLCLRY